MRRRTGWLGLGLALVATAAGLGADKVTRVTVGDGPAYRALGELAMMHEGRVKPIDTVAREEIKQIYTREAIKLTSEDGKTVTTWGPVAAFFDWSVRPKFWDAQPIIAFEYLPLKRFLLADEIRNGLDAIAGKASTSEADRGRLKALASKSEIDAAALRDVVRDSKLALDDGRAVLKLAAKVGEETRWMTPEDLETAQVGVDGKAIPFVQWLDGVTRRKRASGSMGNGGAKLTDVEEKGYEAGIKLGRYRAIRDKDAMGMVPLLVMPRPANPAMLAFTAEAIKKIQDHGDDNLTLLENESAGNLSKYLNDIPGKDRALPGSSPEFDARYAAWLKEKAAWVPLGVLREVPLDELGRAGFPTAKVEAFRSAFKALDDAELANPGRISEGPAVALIAAARDLGGEVNAASYPSAAALAREVHFNDFAPFLKAPMAYLAGALLLVLSLAARSYDAPTNRIAGFGRIGRGLYLAGIAGFASGIALEAYGFLLRTWISGWAPVTNMYETVIWVAMVLSVLGFIIEAIYRKTYAALAGSLVALLGTGLAATVPMLDPKIGQLPPVLRDNYWLTVHVLTIVSSYAAFALAWGLGLIASATYLTATYKRTASFAALARPLLPGLPLLGLGAYGLLAFYGKVGSSPMVDAYGFWPSVAVVSLGGIFAASGLFAVLGESVNRLVFRDEPNLDDSALAGSASSSRPKVDARARAMQATAAQIKPMANFIYRSMQVGILLVAAGTFLGGWWADKSWGRFWGWDPKEVWALITLLVYLMPLHGRFAGWVNTFWLVMSSVACFCSVLMAWYGVNFVLGVGLHSYGVGEGGQLPVLVATVVMLGFAGGAFWRRNLSSRLPGATA